MWTEATFFKTLAAKFLAFGGAGGEGSSLPANIQPLVWEIRRFTCPERLQP